MTPLRMNMLLTGQWATAESGRRQALDLAIGEVDGVGEEGLAAQPAGAVVDVEVVDGVGEQLGDRGDLAARPPRGASARVAP